MIEISAGTYNETLDIKGKALTMRSTDPTNPTVVQNTIIDAGGMTGVGPVITMNTGEGDDTILNGLTITGGNAFLGGGLFLDQTSPIVMNCDFAMHNSGVGGAVYAFDGTPCFDNCSFSGSTTGLGGGIYFEDCDDAKVTNCLFTSNTCGEGGGIHNTNSNTIIDSCAFVSNNGLVGGGIYNTQSDPLISNCTFESNEAQDGAGIYNVNQSDPRIANSRFTGNMASNRGGGILMISCDPFIVNCIFDSNSGRLGGGLYSSDSSSPTVVNCTYFANMAKIEGGGVYNADDDIVAGLTIANCIFFTNLPEQIFEGAGSTLTVRNSNVQGGFAGIDNIDAAPQFLNPGSGNFRLFGTSPCVDAGDETLLFMDFWDLDGDMMMGENVPVDFEGNMRVEGFDVDMGAFELNGTGCVGDCAPDNLDGTYGNGIVNVDDLVLAITSFGPGSGPCDIAPLGGNGEINIDDLIGIIAAFGACP
ncbi:MAG: right-handed parallel beta-helix repeat-containing protein [Planctomycetota bacterium]